MASQPAAGDLVGHSYRLLRRIGAGGTGSVWEAAAEHPALPAAEAGPTVAIKLLHALADKELRTRFEHEARTSARLRSPNIVRLEHYGVENETPFMVLELLTGEDLGARLKRVGQLPFDELLPIARQIAAGLEVAHAASVVHRDLKPANIFIVERPGAPAQIKILDFGIASSDDAAYAGLTRAGRTLGSPHYMSPEQAAGRLMDARSDLWSFGVLLYRAITGLRPFEGPDVASVMVAITKGRPAKVSSIVPSLPADIDAFFTRALRKDAQDRFQTVRQMIDALSALRPAALSVPPGLPALARPPERALPPPELKVPAPESKPRASAPAPPDDDAADGPAWKPLVHRALVAAVVVLCVVSYAIANRDAIRLALRGPPPAPPAPALARLTPQAVVPGVELDGPSGSMALPLDRTFILNIWLQECSDCMPSFDAWRSLSRRSAIPDVPVVNVAYQGANPAWAESYALRENLVVDPGNLLVGPLGVSKFTTFVVAADGTILFRGNPAASSFESQLASAAAHAAPTP